MKKSYKKIYKSLISSGISAEQKLLIEREIEFVETGNKSIPHIHFKGLYDSSDADLFLKKYSIINELQTLDDLLSRDKKREEDGFPRKIKIGKFVKPTKNSKEKIVVVPTTTESKFYHDDSITQEPETGGSGEGEEGDILGEQPAEQQQEEGEGQGAGQGEGAEHDITSDAFDLGKVLTEKFELPNLKPKGKKPSLTKYTYDLTDRNRGFGQLLDKKATIKQVIKTNILLGNIEGSEPFSSENLMLNPQDKIFRILSKEKDFEAQAVVFFLRDYSGSMQGKPTEAIVTQHLFIYSWLMYQYKNNVQVRFILHDTNAKEVKDFYTYYKSAVAGGTSIFPAYQMVNKIIDEEQLARENNIYIFHGTDGDDWEEDGQKAIENIKLLMPKISRMGITVAKNSWSSEDKSTVVENYIDKSNLLKEYSDLFKLDVFSSTDVSEERLIAGIKKIIG